MQAIDVRDLTRQPGASRSVHLEESVPGLHLELAEVPDDRPVACDLKIESVVEGLFVSGRLAGRMMLRCARCLKQFEQGFSVEVDEMFVREPGPDDDAYPVDPQGVLDPEPMVRDAVMLAMPFSPLCNLDCLGICERCGGDRNLGECSCPQRAIDPRWAGLEGLFD